jgi:sarcosine oxidase
MQRYDAIVLGLGAVGSATVYQLARRGVRVLGIDQFAPPHTFGSTHGETRVTRLAIGEGAHYTPLAIRSHEIWRELEAANGASLLTTNGGLIISGASSGSTFHGSSFFATTVEAARKHNITHELLDSTQIRRRFPQFTIGDQETGYYEPSAGFVRPEECIAAQLKLAEYHGARILLNEKVTGFAQDAGRVTVTTKAGRYEADKLVVAAGPWLPQLLGSNYSRHFKIYRQVLSWFDVGEHYADFAPERFPIFIWELPQSRGGIYGFPAVGGPQGGMKIATEYYEATTTPETADRNVSAAEVGSMYRQFVAPYVRGVGPACVKSAVCLYTVTDDFGFVVDRHPQFERIIVASPCSGHGFKHSAALGEAVSDLVQDRQPRFDLNAFGFARFAP